MTDLGHDRGLGLGEIFRPCSFDLRAVEHTSNPTSLGREIGHEGVVVGHGEEAVADGLPVLIDPVANFSCRDTGGLGQSVDVGAGYAALLGEEEGFDCGQFLFGEERRFVLLGLRRRFRGLGFCRAYGLVGFRAVRDADGLMSDRDDVDGSIRQDDLHTFGDGDRLAVDGDSVVGHKTTPLSKCVRNSPTTSDGGGSFHHTRMSLN